MKARLQAPSDYPGGKQGTELTVGPAILGMPFVGLNGGPNFKFNEAISFQVFTDSQEETDRYWNAIVGGGGVNRSVAGARTGSACPGRSCLAR